MLWTFSEKEPQAEPADAVDRPVHGPSGFPSELISQVAGHPQQGRPGVLPPLGGIATDCRLRHDF